MKNHKLKIENLPILTEELSHDELASVKGGFSFSLTVGGNSLLMSIFDSFGLVLEVEDDDVTFGFLNDDVNLGVKGDDVTLGVEV